MIYILLTIIGFIVGYFSVFISMPFVSEKTWKKLINTVEELRVKIKEAK